jgi:molybdopterin-guanine dinucleotide biosynthesis protein A
VNNADIVDARVAGAVLAGGASRRMGRDKALLEVRGVAMARLVADALADAGCEPVVAIGGDERALAALGLRVVADRWPGEGPLGAILTALEDASVPTLVVACDLPWMNASVLESVIAVAAASPDADVVAATTDRLEPLCALWFPRARPALIRAFEAGERAVHRAMTGVHVAACSVDARALRNVNTPTDLAEDTPA